MSIYAISTWLFANVAADDAIRLMSEADFTEAELSGTGSSLVTAWEGDPAGVCAKLAAAGVSVPSIHNTNDARYLSSPDDDVRLASVRENVRYFSLMTACGIPEIVVHPVGGLTDDDWSAAEARSKESLKMLAGEAGDAGIRLAVENVGRDGHPGSTMASILGMIDGLGEHVGLCMDIGHSQMADLDLLDELFTALASGRLFSLHLHDVDPDGRDHYIPGEGRIDFEPCLAMLAEHDYRGGRTFEIRPADPDDVAERTAEVAAARDRWEGQ
jgi:sugar phosphate isomerase/epimerase